MTARTILVSAALLAGLAACAPKPAPAAAASTASPAAAAAAAVDPNAKMDGDLTFASTSPFWSATVTGADRTIKVVRPMRDDDHVVKSAWAGDANGGKFSGTTEKDGDVVLTIERKPCKPGHNEPMWPFSGTITLEGRTYNGCAAPGSPHIPG
jgi:uncharacterized membrane protein